MVEEVPIILDGPSWLPRLYVDRHWRVSGRDVEIPNELITLMRSWLPIFDEVEDIRHVADAIEAVEGIKWSSAPPDPLLQITAKRVNAETGGRSCTVTISDETIDISCDEWVPCLNGGLESGTVLSDFGHPLSITLDKHGSFDRERFMRCWHWAAELGPEGPGDHYVDGEVHVEE